MSKIICDLDRGTCSNQFGLDHMTGCNSTEKCNHKRIIPWRSENSQRDVTLNMGTAGQGNGNWIQQPNA